ncbi:AMP-binding protein [Dactylosporangium sp. NPDC051484]|uniref:AMP-binding protein n=1 Tax=Dactylosporangium sp. NPDC051484 TaxID=3154942 RepID=UPI00344EEE65
MTAEQRPQTVADLLLRRGGDSRPGLRTFERTWSWDEVVRASAARAALAQRLRRPGPFHIGVLLNNVPEFAFWLGAAALAGATIVGINSTKRGEYLEQEVAHTDCQLIITDAAGLELLRGLDVGVAPDRYLLIDTPQYAELVAGESDAPAVAPEVGPATRMLLLFTSGTTGASKAAICSQSRLVGLGYMNRNRFGLVADDVCYCCMPMFHGNALMALWAPALVAGACIALTPRFSASRFLPEVRAYGATYFTYVGKAVGYLLATPARPDDGDNPLVHAFGTEASPADREEFLRRFGCPLTEGFGSSEAGGFVLPGPDTPPNALGRPTGPNVVVVDPETRQVCPPAVLDEHGRVTNAEESVGAIVDLNGEAKFEGYYKNPEANAEKIRHGWYWTGDLGYVDGAGFMYFAGREGDWIRVDGENISALHVERVLQRHPAVVAASVFAVPDPRSGDQVMAAVEVSPATTFDDLRLTEFLAAQDDLGSKDLPRYVRFSYGLPTTGSGKIRKKDVKVEGWRCADPVYWWAGRTGPAYTPMTDDDKRLMREEFQTNGRLRFLPM